MTRPGLHMRLARGLLRFWRREDGTTLVELAMVLPAFLLLFFGLIDFGLMGSAYVMAEKAMQTATRIAVVRPPMLPLYCTGAVPSANLRGTVPVNTTPPRFGTSCSAGPTICANPGTITCTGNAADPTMGEIWARISPLMPPGATPANVRISYTFDPELGFLGGPYVPIVTVEIQGLAYQFATPLGGLTALAGGNGSPITGPNMTFPPMSMSLPGEDLNSGVNG